MTEGNKIVGVDIGKLGGPIEALVRKISNAVGILYEPTRVVRLARANSKAALIEKEGELQTLDLERRAARRILHEDVIHQQNMERVTALAIPMIGEHAAVENIDDDWLSYFFSRCRTVTNEEMQMLWARLLAEEANTPGTISKRTIIFLETMDRSDAEDFSNLCRFMVVGAYRAPLITFVEDPIYWSHGVNERVLAHLASINLITLTPFSFKYQWVESRGRLQYFDENIQFTRKQNAANIDAGRVMLTKVGLEIEPICSVGPVDGFLDYILRHYQHHDPQVKGKSW